jgi:hypothetical protein
MTSTKNAVKAEAGRRAEKAVNAVNARMLGSWEARRLVAASGMTAFSVWNFGHWILGVARPVK